MAHKRGRRQPPQDFSARGAKQEGWSASDRFQARGAASRRVSRQEQLRP